MKTVRTIPNLRWWIALLLAMALAAAGVALPADPPVIPVGLDAYRMWERWPYQRIGARAYMRSTYDRRRRQRARRRVALPLSAGRRLQRDARRRRARASSTSSATTTGTAAPGTTRWTARTTSSRRPARPIPTTRSPNSVFLPEALFPNPLTWTWSTHQGRRPDVGADPVREVASAWPTRGRATERATTSTISSSTGAKLSRPIVSWDGKTPPDKDVLELIARAGEDIAPQPGTAGVKGESGELNLPASGWVAGLASRRGAGHAAAARVLACRASRRSNSRRARLRVTWDDRKRTLDRRARRPVLRRRHALQPRRTASTWSRASR